MKQAWDGNERRKSLRIQAEAMVSGFSPGESAEQPAEVLMHELLVHKVELEMQNDELRRTHAELEEARDRYIDLYEFAPVAYITVSREGLMTEINLTGSRLLGTDRSKLINRRFSAYIAAEDKDHWYRLALRLIEHPEIENQSIDLQILRADNTVFPARLDCLSRQTGDKAPILRIAMMDISKHHQD